VQNQILKQFQKGKNISLQIGKTEEKWHAHVFVTGISLVEGRICLAWKRCLSSGFFIFSEVCGT